MVRVVCRICSLIGRSLVGRRRNRFWCRCRLLRREFPSRTPFLLVLWMRRILLLLLGYGFPVFVVRRFVSGFVVIRVRMERTLRRNIIMVLSRRR